MIKLMQGDCLELLDRVKTNSIDLVLTDPPYGITACKWDSVIPLEPMWKQIKRVSKERAAIVFTFSQPFTSILICSNLKEFKYTWVWDKGQGTGFLNAKKQPLRNYEDVVVFYRSQCKYFPIMRKGFKPYIAKQGKTKSKNYGSQTGATTKSNGERYPLTILEFSRDKNTNYIQHKNL